jgi:putative acetyltransferase
MIEIKPIEPHQIADAKRLIVTVADTIYPSERSIDESLEFFEAQNAFDDMLDVPSHYFDQRGIFLAALDDGRLIGTGAIRQIDTTIGELKRMWLLPEFHGRGIGYRIIQMLFDFARNAGYKMIRLETGAQQTRAIKFYERQGFYRIAPLAGDADDVWMEMSL